MNKVLVIPVESEYRLVCFTYSTSVLLVNLESIGANGTGELAGREKLTCITTLRSHGVAGVEARRSTYRLRQLRRELEASESSLGNNQKNKTDKSELEFRGETVRSSQRSDQ